MPIETRYFSFGDLSDAQGWHLVEWCHAQGADAFTIAGLSAAAASDRMRAFFADLAPFARPAAVRRVLTGTAEGRYAEILTLETCPASYSAAYQITLLKPPLLEEARRRGLISQRATRPALIAFRREFQQRSGEQIDVPALTTERRRLEAQLARLDKQRQTIQARMAEIENILENANEAV
jgi:hypothetical protein